MNEITDVILPSLPTHVIWPHGDLTKMYLIHLMSKGKGNLIISNYGVSCLFIMKE